MCVFSDEENPCVLGDGRNLSAGKCAASPPKSMEQGSAVSQRQLLKRIGIAKISTTGLQNLKAQRCDSFMEVCWCVCIQCPHLPRDFDHHWICWVIKPKPVTLQPIPTGDHSLFLGWSKLVAV